MTTAWAICAGAFLVLEAVTTAMISIWFCAGALAALIAAALGAGLWLQLLLFAAVSAVCFILLYPQLKRFVKRSGEATNADRLIGQQCVVSEDICALSGSGSVYIDGKTWSARTDDGTDIASGTRVSVQDIQGVKLIVSALNK